MKRDRRHMSGIRLATLAAGIVAAWCAAGLALPGAAPQALITNLGIQPYYFSPARGDSLTIRYTLSDTATVYLLIVRTDSSTVVDTLVTGALLRNAEHRAVWKGKYFDGTPAPEDTFLAVVQAESKTQTQSLFSPHFFIDETSPQVAITLVDPGVIAPGSTDPAQSADVEITSEVADPPPTDSLQVDVVIRGPQGTQVEALPERLVPATGPFKSTWSGNAATEDGLHTIDVTVRDRASNSASARAFVDVDREGPTVTITGLEDNSTIRTLPDSLWGWAWDRSGMRDTVWVEYPTRSAFIRAPSSYVRLDTLFFGIVLADSIASEGKHSFRFKAFDKRGQERIKPFDVTWDATPPPAPVLDQPPAVSHSPEILLDGTVSGNQSDVMSIYRNDALADTLFPKIEGQWPHAVTLVSGANRIWAVIRDSAGNTSAPSNTIEVTFDPSAGLFVPQPFRPGDSFQVNPVESAYSVTLRIYDLNGNLVRVFDQDGTGEFVPIPWNGLDGDGEEVGKGPLVAVAAVKISGSNDQVFREIFLFEP